MNREIKSFPKPAFIALTSGDKEKGRGHDWTQHNRPEMGGINSPQTRRTGEAQYAL